MKNAIRAALAQVGTDEANFGLMRFPQIENAATTNCPAAHWSNGGNSTSVGGNNGCRTRPPELERAGDDLRDLVRQRHRPGVHRAR